MRTAKDTIIKINTCNSDGKVEFCIFAKRKMKSISISVDDGRAQANVISSACDVKTASVGFEVKNARIWSIGNPNLYSYRLEIDYGNDNEIVEGRFAFRTISTNGKEICLNGTPIFVCGYIRGTTAHEHSNNGKLLKTDFYRKNIMAAKKFGFNFVRFHSVVPDEEFFDVADELGMLVQLELRPPHSIYNNLEEMVNNGDMTLTDEFVKDVIERLYNHPSLAVYCIGNEIKNIGSDSRVYEISRLIKSADPGRLFIDTCAWGENNRPNVDIDIQHMSYYFPFGAHADMYENTDNLLVVGASCDRPLKSEGVNSCVSRVLGFNVPLIAHEVCHYTALRDFKGLKEKFIQHGTPCPWWIDEVKRTPFGGHLFQDLKF